MQRRFFIRTFSFLFASAVLFLIGGAGSRPAHADADYLHRVTPQITAIIREQAEHVMSDPLLFSVLREAEGRRRDPAEIMALDRQWREEAGPGKGPLIDGILTSPPSRRLEKVRLPHDALLADMMLIDSQGLLAAVTRLTSDYIQGDEAKYLETFPHGTGTIHIEAPHYDESVQDYVITASITLGDPVDSHPLGVLTVTINLEMLKP